MSTLIFALIAERFLILIQRAAVKNFVLTNAAWLGIINIRVQKGGRTQAEPQFALCAIKNL